MCYLLSKHGGNIVYIMERNNKDIMSDQRNRYFSECRTGDLF